MPSVTLSAEVPEAGSAIPTVQQIGRCHSIVFFSSPVGATSRGDGLCQIDYLLSDALALIEQAALITLQVEQTKPRDIGCPLFIEEQGGGVRGGESHRGGLLVN